MQFETCTVCGRLILVMCQQGTGFCSKNCEDTESYVHRVFRGVYANAV